MQHYPKVTIGVVLYKVNPHLKECLTSLTEQDYPNIEYILRDQSPNGEAYDFIEKKLPDVFDVVRIEKGENLFHSGGHNAIIRQMTGEYYICASNDMLYPPNFVYSMVIEMEKHENKKYGSATCKLMSWDFVLRSDDYPEIDKTTVIDSCGLGIRKNHLFYDIGQGAEDRSQYDHKREIFGASGALAVYRKKALDDIVYSLKNQKAKVKKLKHIEYFDELLHYKNDVDLAYRLQWAGWPCLFMPEVKVYHDRLARNPSQSGLMLMRLIKARKNKPKWIKENSFFGQQVVMMKDYSKKFSLSVRISTALQQFGTFLFALILEPYLLKQLKSVKKHKKEILAKRDLMKRVVPPEEIEKFMS
jgi:GT2 family glycosyltransferase